MVKSTPESFCKMLKHNYSFFFVCKTGEITRINKAYIYLEKLGKVPSTAAYGIRVVRITIIFLLFLRDQVTPRRPAGGRH